MGPGPTLFSNIILLKYQPYFIIKLQIIDLVGIFIEKAAEDRHEHDPEVEPDRPVLDVVEVTFDALLNAGIAPPAIDLRPARDPGLGLMAQVIARNLLAEIINKHGALWSWTDQAHVAREDVKKLR